MNCNPTLLQQSLDDRLTEAEEESLSAHLSQCETCQRELEKLASRPVAWTRVGATLKAACESREVERSGIGFVRVAESDSAADFVVECLEPSTSSEDIGRLGDIEVQEVIGHGGMGVVLKGYQPELKRLVAVKVLAPQLAVSAAARKRFAREAQATAAILHPNVMPILTVHSSGKLPLVVGACVAAGIFGLAFFEGTPPIEPQVSTKSQPPIKSPVISTDSSISWDADKETVSASTAPSIPFARRPAILPVAAGIGSA